MKLNSIALLTAVTMLNVIPTVVFAQNSDSGASPVTASSDTGSAPSEEPTGQMGSDLLPLQEKEPGSATGAQDKGGAMGNNTGNADSNSGSKDGSSSH